MKKAMPVLAAVLLTLAVTTGTVGANALLTGKDVRNGSLTGADIKPASLSAALFTGGAAKALRGTTGATGSQGADGRAGTNGGPGATGLTGATGVAGATGATGPIGLTGSNGANGTVTPLAVTSGLVVLPTATTTTILSLSVPAGHYVVMGKTQLMNTGAADSITCTLRAAATTIDTTGTKGLAALAYVTVPFQAVTTTTGAATLLTVQCNVTTAGGTADLNSLIAIPTA